MIFQGSDPGRNRNFLAILKFQKIAKTRVFWPEIRSRRKQKPASEVGEFGQDWFLHTNFLRGQRQGVYVREALMQFFFYFFSPSSVLKASPRSRRIAFASNERSLWLSEGMVWHEIFFRGDALMKLEKT